MLLDPVDIFKMAVFGKPYLQRPHALFLKTFQFTVQSYTYSIFCRGSHFIVVCWVSYYVADVARASHGTCCLRVYGTRIRYAYMYTVRARIRYGSRNKLAYSGNIRNYKRPLCSRRARLPAGPSRPLNRSHGPMIGQIHGNVITRRTNRF